MAPKKRVDDVVDTLGFGWAQWRAILVGGGIWAADGSELLLISSITNALSSDWKLNGTERGLVVTLVYVGVLAGNAMSGTVGDFAGRRIPILVSYLCIVLFSILSALSWGVWTMGACRMLVGLAFGLGQPAWNTLGAEISPMNSRVLVNAASQVLFVLGEMYSAGLIWADDPQLEDLNWRTLLVLGALPSAVFGLAAAAFLVESPKYLVTKDRFTEAFEALDAVASANGQPPVPRGDFAEAETPKAERELGLCGRLRMVWGARLGFTTFVVCFSTFTLNFLYYGSIYAFPQVLPSLKLQISPGANLVLGAVVEIPGFLLAIWVVGATTRQMAIQTYLLSSLLTIVFFLYGTGMDATLSVTEQQHPWAVYVGFLGMKAFVNIGFVVVYSYASEIYPTPARTTGTATCLAAGRIGAMVCPLVYEALTNGKSTFHSFFICIGILTLCNAALASFLTIETAGKRLSDVLELEPLHQ
mmetsp:Transcript_62173/g.181497  ORF Transcript_62173/g.181497 Transcript_62173/m.181497 type:complete len:472 (-) Transcript_62173:6-1421(-)